MADLAERGVPTTDVQLLRVTAVTWSDGSLGCPQPGQHYTQATVPGLEVVLSADGQTYDYHFGASATPRLCTRPHTPASANPNA